MEISEFFTCVFFCCQSIFNGAPCICARACNKWITRQSRCGTQLSRNGIAHWNSECHKPRLYILASHLVNQQHPRSFVKTRFAIWTFPTAINGSILCHLFEAAKNYIRHRQLQCINVHRKTHLVKYHYEIISIRYSSRPSWFYVNAMKSGKKAAARLSPIVCILSGEIKTAHPNRKSTKCD